MPEPAEAGAARSRRLVQVRRWAFTLLSSALCTAVCAAAPSDAEYVPPARGMWQTVEASVAGFDPARLEAALDFAFSRRSSDVVVVHGGRIVAERHAMVADAPTSYRNTLHATTENGRPIEDVASVQKSVVSLLVGVARERGELQIEQSVSDLLGQGWSRSPESESQITVRHLLTMTSGLDTALAFAEKPGEVWQYNTNAYAKLGPVLEKATGRSLGELTSAWITAPLGMVHSGWAPRPWVAAGADANAVGFVSTARDLARLGLLMLRRGAWGEESLVPGGWIAESTSSSQTHNPAYGFLWWCNAEIAKTHQGTEESSRRFPNAPPDLYAALGAQGRRIYVVPSLDLVVTRLGAAPGDGFDEEFWRLLTAARAR